MEAKKTFRRLKAYRQIPILRAALNKHAENARTNTVLEKVRTVA
jgi:hypothetical protein